MERPAVAPELRESWIDATDAPFDLQAWPFYWVTRTNNQYLRTLERSLKTSDLDIPSWRVLMLLHGKQAQSVSYLAEEAIIKRSTMTRIIQRMEEEGLITTRARASDNRVTEVLLTHGGRQARIRAQRHAFRVFAKAFNGVAQQEIRRLNAVLRKALSNLSEG